MHHTNSYTPVTPLFDPLHEGNSICTKLSGAEKRKVTDCALSFIIKTRVNYIMKVGANCHFHVINLIFSCIYLFLLLLN